MVDNSWGVTKEMCHEFCSEIFLKCCGERRDLSPKISFCFVYNITNISPHHFTVTIYFRIFWVLSSVMQEYSSSFLLRNALVTYQPVWCEMGQCGVGFNELRLVLRQLKKHFWYFMCVLSSCLAFLWHWCLACMYMQGK